MICSYPTYEEWKRARRLELSYGGNSSYPTYEEWKLSPIPYLLKETAKSSYPTYEEWKQSIPDK